MLENKNENLKIKLNESNWIIQVLHFFFPFHLLNTDVTASLPLQLIIILSSSI